MTGRGGKGTKVKISKISIAPVISSAPVPIFQQRGKCSADILLSGAKRSSKGWSRSIKSYIINGC